MLLLLDLQTEHLQEFNSRDHYRASMKTGDHTQPQNPPSLCFQLHVPLHSSTKKLKGPR